MQLLAPIARQVLIEINRSLLLNTGQLTETGLRRIADGGLNASWVLSWPEQRAAGIDPIMLQAYFGGGFHHPHLRGTTVHDWPVLRHNSKRTENSALPCHAGCPVQVSPFTLERQESLRKNARAVYLYIEYTYI